MKSLTRRLIGAAAVITTVALAASAVAVAGQDPGPGKKKLTPPFPGSAHAGVSLIKTDGSTDAIAFDRGEITGKGTSSITLGRSDGVSVTLTVDSQTRATKRCKLEKLETRDRVLAWSRAGTAFLIRCYQRRNGPATAPAAPITASPTKMALPRLGKGVVHADVNLIKADGSSDSFSYDRGTVTAESDSSVTLKRADGQSVVLGVNADTKIRGKLRVDSRAVVFSRGGTAVSILAAAPKS